MLLKIVKVYKYISRLAYRLMNVDGEMGVYGTYIIYILYTRAYEIFLYIFLIPPH